MILFPTANLAGLTPKHRAEWTAIALAHGGVETPEGVAVPWQEYNAISAARHSGVYDAVKYPPPEMPPEPAPVVIAPAPAIVDNRTGGRGCYGCGGVSAVNATGSPGAINAVLTE